jgi:hypothetical protein
MILKNRSAEKGHTALDTALGKKADGIPDNPINPSALQRAYG